MSTNLKEMQEDIKNLMDSFDDLDSNIDKVADNLENLNTSIERMKKSGKKLYLRIPDICELTGFSLDDVVALIKANKIPGTYMFNDFVFNYDVISDWSEYVYEVCELNNGYFDADQFPKHDFQTCKYDSSKHKVRAIYYELEELY